MEFLNGGDLMYHIQDKGRFELYRATYVRALMSVYWGESTAGLPSVPASFFLEQPARARAGGGETGAGGLPSI